MSAARTPVGLGAGGRTLWKAVMDAHELDAIAQVTLLEACRSKDRLDKLDGILRGEASQWMKLVHRTTTEDYELVINQALAAANSTANLLKQLMASLRLPDDVSGKRPQQRGGARGAYSAAATPKAGRVSSLDAARKKAASS